MVLKGGFLIILAKPKTFSMHYYRGNIYSGLKKEKTMEKDHGLLAWYIF